MSKFKVGDRVRLVSAVAHDLFPCYYPPIGTVGEVLIKDEDGVCYVQWPHGSTSEDDKGYAAAVLLELVEVPV